MKGKKIHVGKFSTTDQNGSISFVGSIEVAKGYAKPLFFINTDVFNGEDFISMSVGSLVLRKIANELKNLSATIVIYSGGNAQYKKTLCISPLTKKIAFTMEHKDKKLTITIDNDLAYSLACEISLLTDETMRALYKTQQFLERKHAKAKKEN